MSPARYLTCSALVFLLVGALVAYYHYRADRWGVFAWDYQTFHKRILINKLFLKTRYLLNEEHEFNCYAFGSSRLAALDARHFGDRCYNFTHSAGLVADHLRAVKTLLDAGLPVEKVYIALDDLSYNEDPSLASDQHMRRAYPVDLGEYLGFGSLFLMRPVDLTDVGLVTGRNPKEEIPRFIVDPNLDTERIRLFYKKFFDDPRGTDARFRRLKGLAEGDSYHGAVTMDALREFRALADRHGFELEVFSMPLHYKTYLARDYRWFTRFKREVASILPFRDFSGLNAYTTDNRYWRETSHFSAVVGDVVAGAVADRTVAADGRMGRKISADNIDEEEQRQLQIDATYLPRLIRREGLMPLPPRFAEFWREQNRLESVRISRHGAPSYMDLSGGGKVHLTRANTGRERLGEVRLALQRGDFFILRFRIESMQRKQFQLQMVHDQSDYEGRFREHRLHLDQGHNTGLFAGYASVDRPLIRLVLGGGEAQVAWEALQVEKISLSPAQRAAAEGYDDHYPVDSDG
jgi:hypothetical protein